MLEVIDLSKRYKTKFATKNVNLFIEQGEIIGLLGPNGAGKSTTISMISTLIPPTSGDVRFKSKSVINNPQMIRSALGVVPQEIALYEELTAKENLQFFGRIYHITGKKLKTRVEEVLELIGLTERKNDLVKTFSGGMKRRLNIGVALMHKPELIIMDEPTVGIDPQSRNYILETVKKMNNEFGTTVLYTSHYMEEVEYLCDQIYIMDQGEIIASGTKDELKNILSSEHTIVVRVERLNETFIKAIQSEPNILNVTILENELKLMVPKEVKVFERIFELAKESEVTLTSIEQQAPTLEDVFLHLTGKQLRD